MEEYFSLLLGTTLFRGMNAAELSQLMNCFRPKVHIYGKGSFLLLSGCENHDVGILLEGTAQAIKNTVDGSEVIITHLNPGDVFGDVLSGSDVKSPVSVLACAPCKAVYFPYQKIIHPCAQLHSCHSRLMENLVATISAKYFALNSRIDLLILKSLRAKLCTWLLAESAQCQSDTFSVGFTRSSLADYLNCERSALSRELSRMQSEGLIELYKNSFKLLNKEALKEQAVK